MYTIMYIYPNIAFALRKLSQYIQDLSKRYWIYLKALIRYIRLSVYLQLRFRYRKSPNLIVYTNAD